MTHIFKYTFKQLLRNKSELFWILLFPIMLGCLFKIAFSNIGAAESFQAIPVAIVCEESDAADAFKTVADGLSEEGDDQLLTPTYCEEKKALQLLEAKEITGIIYAGDTVKLTVSANMTNDSLNQSILDSFVTQYNMNSTAFADIAMNHPEQLQTAVKAMTDTPSFNKEVSLSSSTTDTYTQYFYNLIAMACLYTGMAGVYVSVHNQGNLSALGARRNISPTNKMKNIVAELFSNIVFQFLCNLIGFFFLLLVLKAEIGAKLPFAILTVFVSCLTGVTMGFFIGAFGNLSSNVKEGIVLSISMICCFLSGLMVGNMRVLVDMVCPAFNRINPAALISDSFYSLSMYDTMTRYSRNIITLLILSTIFCVGGFLLTRRKKYASL